MSEAATIPGVQLALLAGLSDRRLRQLAAEGWFPKANDGAYPLVPTIQGLLRYYRQREESRLIQDSYDSVSACAAATGIPVSTLKHAKRNGCSAFRGSRVYLAPLLRWIFASPDGALTNYDQERAQQVVLQNAKLKVELRQLKHELVPIDDVRAVGAELGGAIRKVVTQLHRHTPDLVGRDTAEVEARLKAIEDDVLRQLHGLDTQLARLARDEADGTPG